MLGDTYRKQLKTIDTMKQKKSRFDLPMSANKIVSRAILNDILRCSVYMCHVRFYYIIGILTA